MQGERSTTVSRNQRGGVLFSAAAPVLCSIGIDRRRTPAELPRFRIDLQASDFTAWQTDIDVVMRRTAIDDIELGRERLAAKLRSGECRGARQRPPPVLRARSIATNAVIEAAAPRCRIMGSPHRTRGHAQDEGATRWRRLPEQT